MTTSTLTITEFLLARIADTEATARDMQDQARLGRPFIDPERLAGGTGIRRIINPEHILHDCEAKRRIVERHTNCDDTSFGHPCADLLALASVYADHPDYRDEWRP